MRILSGLKPTGRPHLGNYFGAIRQWIELQQEGDGLYFIADLHALDGLHDADAMRAYTLDAALDYLALGLDPERCTLFVQSQVSEISELMWILGSVAPMGLLQRAHAYKDAVAKGKDADFGLFAYPVLMAADILLYRSDVVPVGKDQKQHIEIARDLAVKFNNLYCPDFDAETGKGGALVVPEARTMAETALVPGTDGQKMSKSYGNTVELFAPDKQVKKAIMRTVTDSTPVEDPKDPDNDNVFAMLEQFHAHFDAARARRHELAKNLDHVHGVLAKGAERARTIGREVLDDVQKACGLR